MHRPIVGATIVLCLGLTSPAVALDVLGPPVVVWDDADSTVDAMTGDIVYNPEQDEYLVLFTTLHSARSDIYARRLAGDGTPLSWFCVYSAPGEFNGDPRGAYSTAQHEYLVVWTNEVTEEEDDVLGRTVSWNGDAMGPLTNVASYNDIQRASDVAYNPNADEYLVVYFNEWSGGLLDVAAQRVRASDGVLLSWANVATTPADESDSRWWPQVAFSSESNTYLISYVVNRTGVRGKVTPYDLAGVSAAPEILIYDDPTAVLSHHSASAASPGGFLVTWLQEWVAKARRLSLEGVPQGPPGGFDLDALPGGPTENDRISASYGQHDHYVVAWEAWVPCNSLDIIATAIRPGADVPGVPIIPAAEGIDEQRQPVLACAPSAACMMAYTNDTCTAPGCYEYDVHARAYRPIVFNDGFKSGTIAAWSNP